MTAILPKFFTKELAGEQYTRIQLAAAYRVLALMKMDDLTYTHLSARLPGANSYFIYPFGLLFEEVTASGLLKVSLDGEVLEGEEREYNQTGYVIHGNIYKNRPDVNAVFHMHTIAGVAVSAMDCGLLPLSQFSFHFYNRIAYHSYDSLALDNHRQGADLVKDLGQKRAMILQNHGTLTCGATVHEAFLYAYFLEQACKVQCAALRGEQKVVIPPKKVCEQAAQDVRNFEPDFGLRDWTAVIRKLDRTDPTYKD
ncbi:MAG TPA: class II aldolase/adducin family protein [Alphaproteobacteria bacterium]|nr:class II aldolase/adducin family protein [Alphaproteobacteria bacterium]